MSLSLFALLFWTMSFTPGPNMLLAMSFGLSAGWQKTLPLIFGAVCALACVVLVCGVGIGAVFAANEFIFRAFMCACATYLVFLAIKMWQNARNTEFRAQKNKRKARRTLYLWLHKLPEQPQKLGCLCRAFAAFFRQSRPAKCQICAHRGFGYRHRICEYVPVYAGRANATQSPIHASRAFATLFGYAHRPCRADDDSKRVLGRKSVNLG